MFFSCFSFHSTNFCETEFYKYQHSCKRCLNKYSILSSQTHFFTQTPCIQYNASNNNVGITETHNVKDIVQKPHRGGEVNKGLLRSGSSDSALRAVTGTVYFGDPDLK